MKSLTHILFAFLIISTSSCSESVAPLTDNIQGKWQLTETLADPGDGSGTWQKAVNSQFITFKQDGTFIDSADPVAGKNYRIIKKDSAMQITRIGNTHDYMYRIQEGELLLQPLCIEPCGTKYKKVSENQ